MIKYEVVSKTDISPDSEKIQQVLVDYLGDPTFYKVRDLGDPNTKTSYSMYANKAYCLLTRECRYGILFIMQDNFPVGTPQKLSQLPWVSFQTRTLTEEIDVPTNSYNFYSYEPLQSAKITREQVTDEASVYTCDKYPIKVALLHTKKNTKDSYQANGNLLAAIITWETVITLV